MVWPASIIGRLQGRYIANLLPNESSSFAKYTEFHGNHERVIREILKYHLKPFANKQLTMGEEEKVTKDEDRIGVSKTNNLKIKVLREIFAKID